MSKAKSEKKVEHSQEEFDNIVQGAYKNGAEDAKSQIKQNILNSLRNLIADKFMAGEPDVAKEKRKIYKAFEEQL